MTCQDSKCAKALIAKAEALYNICDFEHSLMLFIRGRRVAPDSSVAATGVSKSTKTILNKISHQDVFFFKNSKHFFDFLRKDGSESVEKFLKNENKFKYAVSLKTITNAGIKGVSEELSQKVSKYLIL